MAEFFAWGNESVNIDNITQARWEPAANGFGGLIKLYCGGQQHAISFDSPDIDKVAGLVGFADKLTALKAARKEAAEARELAEMEKATAPKPATPTRPAGRPLARV